ncbi:hypothetical protein VFPFJ_09879 [Purpureocillium lilacinum]|uniref:Uncharacterized protein n=1 Tax=Purpureocillium lilacinum TaxID=33203 RepID=A0A179GPY9_PURLI|nr:hypothetical protein VFPFJ_09879 [Purpureocillium lilacinum]OAQ79393.1 hypothetical protein VFPFJ_09879 [Purpureocillium lilacinum]
MSSTNNSEGAASVDETRRVDQLPSTATGQTLAAEAARARHPWVDPQIHLAKAKPGCFARLAWVFAQSAAPAAVTQSRQAQAVDAGKASKAGKGFNALSNFPRVHPARPCLPIPSGLVGQCDRCIRLGCSCLGMT